MLKLLVLLLVVALVVGGCLGWIVLRRVLFARRKKRALAEFRLDRTEIQSLFLQAAAATGKPHGLAWTRCDFQEQLLLARDRANGDLIGLVGATIGFEAIEGGGMEDVEAVGNLRAATAVLVWQHDRWTTQGRAVFNLEPHEVLERYKDSLEPVND